MPENYFNSSDASYARGQKFDAPKGSSVKGPAGPVQTTGTAGG
jgi:hypothetical protein